MQGRFRPDLFYRLSILRLTLPPLRERQADTLPLAESFFKTVAGGDGNSVYRIDTSWIDTVSAAFAGLALAR